MPDVAELVVKIRADASQLAAGLAAAGAQVQGFAAGAGAAASSASEKLAGKLNSAGIAAQQVGSTMMTAGAGIVGALGLAVKAGSDYQNKLMSVANNTLLTKREIVDMDETIRKLAKSSPASLDELAQGFMRIANFGFKGADATLILEAAMKSAVATGAKTDATANALASTMKAFNIPAAQAVKVMNELHLASAMGNETLEEFTAHSGRAHAAASVLGVKLADVDSALSALTRHGFNPAMAETQVLGIMNKIANPAAAVKKLLQEISKTTGVDLANDFTAAGLKAKGLHGIIEDIRKAASKLHEDPGILAEKLVPAQRGGLGLASLSQDSGFKDKGEIMGKLQGALSGQVDATVSGFNDRVKTLSAQLGILRNQFTLLGADIQRILLPALIPIVQHLRGLIEKFDALPPGVKKAAVEFAAIGGVSLLAGGALLSVGAKAAMIVSALIRLGAVVAPLVGEGGALAGLATILTGPVGIAIAAIVVAVGLLAVAWAKDWGHIREVTAPVIAEIGRFLRELWPPILAIWRAAKVALEAVMAGLGVIFEGTWTHVAAFLRGIWDVIAGIFKVAFALIRSIWEVGLKLLTGDWEGAWKSVLSVHQAAIDGIKQIFDGLVGFFGGLIGTIAQAVLNLGTAIVEGIKNGILSAWDSFKNWFTSLCQSLIDGIKATFGIHSPSQAFHDVGQAIGHGLARGVRSSMGTVRGAFGELMGAAAGHGVSLPGIRSANGGGWVPAGAASGGGGGQTININMPIHTADAGSFHRSHGQIAQSMGRAIARELARSGA